MTTVQTKVQRTTTTYETVEATLPLYLGRYYTPDGPGDSTQTFIRIGAGGGVVEVERTQLWEGGLSFQISAVQIDLAKELGGYLPTRDWGATFEASQADFDAALLAARDAIDVALTEAEGGAG